MKKGFKSIQRKDFLQIVQKISLWESYDAHLKRKCSANSLQAPQLGHFCDPPPLASLPNSSKAMGNLEGAPFTYSKYSSNTASHFNSL